ncbi:hypothetical protein SAMD00019534_038510 [Acytostelium subglobosum LB1]|uniref:hypothetical protein n=1 Tax=Acytostelium subglobosum LB1 TaxID=1410327 RepID=UPI000644F25D|nr:hypothetical protein SAMD00019534_038510 [Acytostelium subglobosum LB1]GAM20676.1 hypothetical protein SAMD00019534_038510 [Acytostelium subglobosum LB1]|eukprot:XP_012760197.1 hypothetical protein SAMD00019534_038510 [Acytostelium subglobosum LB1]
MLVIGCVQLIYASKTKRRVKCPYDSHIFLAYVGDELHQTLTVQLENFITELRQLLQGRQKFFMTSDDIKDDNEQSQDIRYSIEPVVVADMAPGNVWILCCVKPNEKNPALAYGHKDYMLYLLLL